MTPGTSLYLHIPFCTHRCAYCDFNTYAGQESSIPAYVNALIREIEFVGHQTTRLSNHPTTITTIFFGGGTPSLLTPAQFEAIFHALRANFDIQEDSENSIEANPGTVSLDNLKKLRGIGINRISFGVQSANTEELRMLERIHNFFDVIEAVTNARKAGFTNLNLDLIYGLPEQTLQSWQTTLQRIVDLHPEHISAYVLTLEHGTPFGRWSSKGLLPLPDPDLAAEMYECTEEFLEHNGYVHYEISNWAFQKDEGGKPVLSEAERMKDERTRLDSSFILHPSPFECRHNLQYWRSLPYLGLGAGAHGYANGYRYSNALRIKTYIERLTNLQSPILQSPISNYQFPFTPATVNHHKQTPRDDMSEFMLNNLRLVLAGLTESAFRSRFGRGLMEVYPREIEELVRNGL
ncbi:MAG: radical SAM family heme chaperone HemW, partial [Chloroflexota bacterium]